MAFSAVSFYVWTIAAGVNRKDEVSAGAVALTVITGWWVLLSLLWNVSIRSWGPFAQWREVSEKWLAIIGDFDRTGRPAHEPRNVRRKQHFLLAGMCISSVTLLALATWYVCRFGRIANLEVRSPSGRPRRRPRLARPPRRSPLTAIAWKQVRESGAARARWLGDHRGNGDRAVGWAPRHREPSDPSRSASAEMYAGVSVTVGFAVAMIVGIGVFLTMSVRGSIHFGVRDPSTQTCGSGRNSHAAWPSYLSAIYGPIVLAVYPNHCSGRLADSDCHHRQSSGSFIRIAAPLSRSSPSLSLPRQSP